MKNIVIGLFMVASRICGCYCEFLLRGIDSVVFFINEMWLPEFFYRRSSS